MAEVTEMNGVDPDVEQEALTLGWVPEEKFKGDKSRWVDAATFVERGHTLMPILRKNNQELLAKLGAKDTELATLKQQVFTVETSLETMKQFQAAEVKRQVEARVLDLKAQLKTARAEGDNEVAADLAEALDEAKDKLKGVAAPPAPPPPPPKPVEAAVEPWAQAFIDENESWFKVDKKRTALFMAEAEDAFQRGLRGRAVLDAAKEAMEAARRHGTVVSYDLNYRPSLWKSIGGQKKK
jgi:hypothetical protein